MPWTNIGTSRVIKVAVKFHQNHMCSFREDESICGQMTRHPISSPELLPGELKIKVLSIFFNFYGFEVSSFLAHLWTKTPFSCAWHQCRVGRITSTFNLKVSVCFGAMEDLFYLCQRLAEMREASFASTSSFTLVAVTAVKAFKPAFTVVLHGM